MAAGVVLGGCVLMPVIQVGIIMTKTREKENNMGSNFLQGVWCGLAWVRDTVKEKFCS